MRPPLAFLFPGPFSRRQLLAYKIASTLLLSLPTALFMSLVLRVHASWFAAAFVGMLLMVLFMQLFNMTINLLAVSLGVLLATVPLASYVSVWAATTVVLITAGIAASALWLRSVLRRLSIGFRFAPAMAA